jgi:hypothetical protein
MRFKHFASKLRCLHEIKLSCVHEMQLAQNTAKTLEVLDTRVKRARIAKMYLFLLT